MALSPTSSRSSGGGGSVNSVTAGDSSVTVAGTAADPTVAVAASGVGVAKMTSGASAAGTVATADGAGAVSFAASAGGPPSGAAGGALDGTYPNPGIAASVAGAGLAESADVLSVNVDASTIEISADTLRLKDGGTTTAKLASAVTLDAIATAHATAADVSLASHKLTNVTDPASAQDAATKAYVDAAISGLEWKQACDLGTIAALPTNVYANGASGVGATLTGVALGALSVDGTAVAIGQRILVKNEAAGANRGIYTVTVAGSAGLVYVLTRATDYDTTAEIQAGDVVTVTAGGTIADTTWLMTAVGAITVGTTALTFTQFGSVTSVTAADASVVVAGTASAPTLTTGALNTIAGVHATSADLSMNSHKLTSLTAATAATDAASLANTLDQFGAPAANVAWNAKKITGLAAASAGTDAASLANTLDQFAAPAANVAFNAKKITGIANGSAATDSAAFGQIPATGGLTALVYRYTVAGSDKTSIDTGVDTPDAGSNDWTSGDVLEIFIYARTDETAVLSNLDATLNNDTGTNYDGEEFACTNTVGTAGPQLGRANWLMGVAGASAEANLFSPWAIVFSNYTGTVGYKTGSSRGGLPDSTAGNARVDSWCLAYRSTSALTRFKITPDTAGKKLKVGSQLLIYKRLSA